MKRQRGPDLVWVRGHFNGRGAWTPGHWRHKPRTVKVRGYFRGATYVQGHMRHPPLRTEPIRVNFAGLQELTPEALTVLLKDLDPPMGF